MSREMITTRSSLRHYLSGLGLVACIGLLLLWATVEDHWMSLALSALTPNKQGRLSITQTNTGGYNDTSPLHIQLEKRQGRTISVSQPDRCPSIDAKPQTAATSGPNGSIFFLNCGISLSDRSRGKWDPPALKASDLVTNVDFSNNDALLGTIFEPCIPFADDFRSKSAAIGVNPAFLAAFAMQESSCRPYVTGSGGTIGLLQLSPDKCVGRDCYDPGTNIEIGAKYLQTLLSADQNIVLAVGSWNGWFAGMSYNDATGAMHTDCYTQRNLDYLHQYFNGWLQGIDPYSASPKLGFYFNLDACGSSPYPTWSVSAGHLRYATTLNSLVLGTTMFILLYWIL
ncbi:hypothetical protein CPB86DRAFT_604918 [Serendipita vermifera]|nr:hypothetical protein CPB86DRAFT_604918 [Serendipita vermifera]